MKLPSGIDMFERVTHQARSAPNIVDISLALFRIHPIHSVCNSFSFMLIVCKRNLESEL